MKNLKPLELGLGTLFIAYSSLDIQAPDYINSFVNSTLGKVLLVASVIFMGFRLNIVIAVLAVIALYELITRAKKNESVLTDKSMINYLPSTQPDCNDLNAYNQYSKTLEEEVVAKMAPLVGESVTNTTFTPEIENDHNATSLM